MQGEQDSFRHEEAKAREELLDTGNDEQVSTGGDPKVVDWRTASNNAALQAAAAAYVVRKKAHYHNANRSQQQQQQQQQ